MPSTSTAEDFFSEQAAFELVEYLLKYAVDHGRWPRVADVLIDVPSASVRLLYNLAHVGFVLLAFNGGRFEDRPCVLLRNGLRSIDPGDELTRVVRVLDDLKARYREHRATFLVSADEIAVALELTPQEAARALTFLFTWPVVVRYVWNNPWTGMIEHIEIDIGILELSVDPSPDACEILCPWDVPLAAPAEASESESPVAAATEVANGHDAAKPTVDELIEMHAPEISRRWNAGTYSGQSRAARKVAATDLLAVLFEHGHTLSEKTVYSKLSKFITDHPGLFPDGVAASEADEA